MFCLSTGQSYGHLYQPFAFGSAGGGGQGVGGTGGGMLWLNITNLIEVDGELSTDGGEAVGNSGGGGSGGSIWMYCRVFRGLGNLIPSAHNINYCAARILICKICLCRKNFWCSKESILCKASTHMCVNKNHYQ